MSVFACNCPKCGQPLQHRWAWISACSQCATLYEVCGSFLLEVSESEVGARARHRGVGSPSSV